MLRDKIINAINAVGFDEYKEISSSDIIFADAVFASCKTNTCGNFGQNHSCPRFQEIWMPISSGS